ncbi:hypothetical protein C2845_PM15G06600 [Panicum miliaceum]|uniref:FAR1 domain-containing protein n=1 Tax=Panicum miliaceum TaxID=4540 RepID=A0A3L6Q9Q9_PANMI|nr:hypothetical protein C2845_PM15G06600 [Panicum miliaceum]
MEDPRSLEIAAVGGSPGEEEQQITQVGSVENEVPNEETVDKYGQNLIPPKVGMSFESEEKAYEMYNTYAGQVGFNVRKSKTKHHLDGSLYQRHLVCSNQEHRRVESSQKDITRTGCDARVQFSISKEGVWTVQKVELEHNHYLDM